MTKEQYERAVQINNRLYELGRLKKEIADTKNTRLWYAYKGETTNNWYLTSKYDMGYISKILDKHDLMIRQEVDEEIEKLKREIETL